MTKQKIVLISFLVFLVLLVLTITTFINPNIVGNQTTTGITFESAIVDKQNNQEPITIVAENLEIPWEIVFLPDESLLITQRPGSLLHITPNSKKTTQISGVEHIGEGGLLGLVLHPNYLNNHWIYLYLTSKTNSGIINRVERYVLNELDNSLSQRTVILDNIPGAVFHDGGRMAFGPDNYLYITTGDAGNTASAQNKNALSGKILRITDTGEIPQDNPFGNEVYSLGHRNPQGIAWDREGNLWETEHGPSGITTGLDELNFIEKGQNYGWPTITGLKTQNGMRTPVLQSGSKVTWAPAGLAIHNNKLYFTGLKGEGLYTARITEKTVSNFKKHFNQEFGRLRAVTISPDKKWLYLSTSNTDGRGTVSPTDDRIIKIDLAVFE